MPRSTNAAASDNEATLITRKNSGMNKVGPMNAMSRGLADGAAGDRHGVVDEPVRRGRISVRAGAGGGHVELPSAEDPASRCVPVTSRKTSSRVGVRRLSSRTLMPALPARSPPDSAPGCRSRCRPDLTPKTSTPSMPAMPSSTDLAASASPSTTTVTTSVPIARLSSLGCPRRRSVPR